MTPIEWTFPDTSSLNVVNHWRERGMRWRTAKEHKVVTANAFLFARIQDARISEAVHGDKRWAVPLEIRTASMRRHVLFERHCKRRYDHTNFVGGCKMLEDALVKAGILVDDTEEWVRPEHKQIMDRPERSYVRVVVSEWEENEKE